MTSKPLSEYDVISNLGILVHTKPRIFHNAFISQGLLLKFFTGIPVWMLIFILAQKVVWGTIYDTLTQKSRFFMSLFGQRPLTNSVNMATAKDPVDQKLLEIVCYMLM